MTPVRIHSSLLCARCLTATIWRYLQHYRCWTCGSYQVVESKHNKEAQYEIRSYR
jgi:hypothetical protein